MLSLKTFLVVVLLFSVTFAAADSENEEREEIGKIGIYACTHVLEAVRSISKGGEVPDYNSTNNTNDVLISDDVSDGQMLRHCF